MYGIIIHIALAAASAADKLDNKMLKLRLSGNSIIKVLFGGCIIKESDSKGLGSTTDANMEQWPISVNKVSEKYSDADAVIPGHGKWGSIELIKHTLELLK